MARGPRHGYEGDFTVKPRMWLAEGAKAIVRLAEKKVTMKLAATARPKQDVIRDLQREAAAQAERLRSAELELSRTRDCVADVTRRLGEKEAEAERAERARGLLAEGLELSRQELDEVTTALREKEAVNEGLLARLGEKEAAAQRAECARSQLAESAQRLQQELAAVSSALRDKDTAIERLRADDRKLLRRAGEAVAGFVEHEREQTRESAQGFAAVCSPPHEKGELVRHALREEAGSHGSDTLGWRTSRASASAQECLECAQLRAQLKTTQEGLLETRDSMHKAQLLRQQARWLLDCETEKRYQQRVQDLYDRASDGADRVRGAEAAARLGVVLDAHSLLRRALLQQKGMHTAAMQKFRVKSGLLLEKTARRADKAEEECNSLRSQLAVAEHARVGGRQALRKAQCQAVGAEMQLLLHVEATARGHAEDAEIAARRHMVGGCIPSGGRPVNPPAELSAANPTGTADERKDSTVAKCTKGDQPVQPGFTTVRCIGKGCFGSAWVVRRHQNGRLYVMKETMTRKDGARAPKNRENIATEQAAAFEYEMLRRCQGHEHVVRAFECMVQTEDQRVRILLELCSGGDLSAAAAATREEPDYNGRAKGWVMGIAKGLHHVHSKCIAHRDIKSANVLLSARNIAMIADFGCAVVVDAQTWTARGEAHGDPSIRAPEMRPPNKYPYTFGTASDVWSMGLLIIELYTGVAARHSVKLPPKVPCHQTVTQCLSVDPGARPWAAHVVAAFASL